MKKLWLVFVVLMSMSSVLAIVPVDTCTDTDGGDDIFTAGHVFGELDGSPYETYDTCAAGAPYLNEMSCRTTDSGMEAFATTYLCEFGCEDGACVENEIPEFGLIAASVALAGAIGGFFLLRKRN